MIENNSNWKEKARKSVKYLTLIAMLIFLISVSIVESVPSAPIITYVSNTTYTSGIVNRSQDAKGTITTVTLASTQQDYKWKAYVGNVSGTLALSDVNGKAIYDWSSGTATGEIYVSRFSNINWGNIACALQVTIDNEQTGIGMATGVKDNINATFNATNHFTFLVGVTSMSNCRSTATYINGAAQTMGAGASFQEVLLRDTGTGNMVYAGLINASTVGYQGGTNRNDFQIIIGENESASTPTPYYFWVELG